MSTNQFIMADGPQFYHTLFVVGKKNWGCARTSLDEHGWLEDLSHSIRLHETMANHQPYESPGTQHRSQ